MARDGDLAALKQRAHREYLRRHAKYRRFLRGCAALDRRLRQMDATSSASAGVAMRDQGRRPRGRRATTVRRARPPGREDADPEPPGLSSEDIAGRIAHTLPRGVRGGLTFVDRLLADSESIGLVERGGQGWRLTRELELRCGQALRDWGPA